MKLCPYCKKEVIKKRNKFCNRSCSTSYNNIQRSIKYKQKIKKEGKKCNTCKLVLDITNFYKNDGKCKKCLKETRKCKHKKRRAHCKKCSPQNFCEHGTRKEDCSKGDCHGSQICEHNRRKNECHEGDCHGSRFCKHGQFKSRCLDCGGSSLCKHGNRKEYCLECGGSAYCKHKIKKSRCPTCGGSGLCIHCKYIQVKKSRYVESLDKKVRCCSGCFYKFYPNDKIPRRYKLKQHYFNDKLKEKFGNDFLQYDRKINGGCSGKIPDWFLDCYTHSIIIELDEEQHKYTSCDEKRNMELFRDLGNRPLVIIRINPDKYKIGKTKKIGCFDFDDKNNIKCLTDEFDIRFNKLVKNLQFFIDNQPIKELTIKKLFFNKKSS